MGGLSFEQAKCLVFNKFLEKDIQMFSTDLKTPALPESFLVILIIHENFVFFHPFIVFV